MPLREDILVPIPGENPSGIDLRRDNKLLIYDKIKEARRQDDDLAQGAWQSERKTANFPFVVKLAQESIATVSKDLQLAAWLTEALLNTERFSGLLQGIDLCHRLMEEFWDTVYPVIEDGDREFRASPLAWVGTMLEFPLRATPITNGGYSSLTYKESRLSAMRTLASRTKTRKPAPK
jgi:type VI secretion system protein ImpA